MRIAQICPYDMGRPGGVQRHVLDTAAALHELGHEVTIISPRVGEPGVAAPPAAQNGPRQLQIGRARPIRFGATAFEVSIVQGADRRRLDRLMKTSGFDIAHYHTVWTPLLPLQALARSRSANVMTFHDTPPDTVGGHVSRMALRGVSRLLEPHVDGAISVSSAPMGHLCGGLAARAVILPPCTDLRRFAPPSAAPGPSPDGLLNILFVGRLEPRKGAIVLLRAFQRLKAEGLPARLTIAGGGEQEETLRRFVADNAVADVVFAGRFTDEEAPDWYAGCDVFCAPSLYGESFGIVLAEAMTSGKPVVAAANRGYRTVMTGSAARFLVPPGDVDALYLSLRDLLDNPALRRGMGEANRRQAAQYDCRVLAPRLVSVYEDAIVRRRRRAEARSSSGWGPAESFPAAPSPAWEAD